MSHIFTPISRDCHGFRTLFLVVLMLVATSIELVANEPIDEPKPFSKCWSIDTAPDLSASAAADDLNVYFFAADGALEAVDQKTGARSWSTDLGGAVVSNLLLTDSAAVFVTAGQQNGNAGKTTLRVVSKQTGITIWSTSIQGGSTTLGGIGDKIVAVNADGLVFVYMAANGALMSVHPVGAKIVAAPLFSPDRLVLATDTNELIAVDIIKGVTARMLRTGRPPTAIFVDREGRMLVGDSRGNLGFMAADGDRIWTFKNGAQISYLLAYDSEYLAASFDNFFYKLSRSGGVEWKRRLSGRVSSPPLVIGNAGVLSITGDPSVYVLDLTNGKIVNRIDVGDDENSSPRVAAAGANGFAVVTSHGLQFFSRDTCPQK